LNLRKWILAALPIVFGAIYLGLAHAQEPPRKFELQAASPQFWKLIGRDAKLATVATGFGFTEGPVWNPSGFLFVSDETINKITGSIPMARKRK